jgi:hypothetical protein
MGVLQYLCGVIWVSGFLVTVEFNGQLGSMRSHCLYEDSEKIGQQKTNLCVVKSATHGGPLSPR